MMSSRFVAPLILVLALALGVLIAESNHEAEILYGWKLNLTDPYNVLRSWDPTLTNPCTWFHVSCNSDNKVTIVDLGNAGLSGTLVPELGSLTNLQYLHVQRNKISGTIPSQLGNLKNLISLGLHENLLSGSIPASLGNLRFLRFMNLNSNNLSGTIPDSVIQLIQRGNLQTLNVSDNQLVGTYHRTNTTGFKIIAVIQDPKA